MLEKVFGFFKNKCKIEVIPRKDVVVLTGEMTLEARETGSTEQKYTSTIIDYPNGFNWINCIPLAVGLNIHTNFNFGWNYSGFYLLENNSSIGDVTDLSEGALYRRINLRKDGVHLTVANPSEEVKNIRYKLVLMKVDNSELYTKGDVNGDGKITLEDTELISKFVMNEVTFNEKQFEAADMNGDGKVTALDYTQLVNKLYANVQKGDVNADGVIDEKDIELVQKYLNGEITLNEKQLEIADMNEDGKVNSTDLLRLREYILENTKEEE